MSDEMRHAIRDEQPFSTGSHRPEVQSLWLLQQMSNFDKHRTLNIAVMAGQWTMFSVFEDPDVDLVPIWSPEGEVARARPRTPEALVRTDPVFKPQVVFDETAGPGEDRPMDVQLETFIRIVSEIVDRLSSRFLSSPAGPNP
jgi:hypothetical protein